MKPLVLSALLCFVTTMFGQGYEIRSSRQDPLWHGMTTKLSNLHHGDIKFISPYHTTGTGKALLTSSRQQILSETLTDSIVSWTWDTTLHQWKFTNRTVDFTYDANNNVLGFTEQVWDGTRWVNSDKYTYMYDANDNQVLQTNQTWNGLAWENTTQSINTFNASNLRTTSTFRFWNGLTWENSVKSIYTYDGENKLTLRVDQNWNITVWEDFEQNIYTYDANGNNTLELIQLWTGSAWENYTQYINTYLEGNLFESELSQLWNGASWDNTGLLTVTYDAGNKPVSELNQYWDGTAWVNSYLSTFQYDGQGNITTYTLNTWAGSGWVNSFAFHSVYDLENNLLNITSFYFNSTGTEVTGRDSTQYYYHSTTGIGDLSFNDTTLSVFPNPGAGHFKITCENSIGNMEIYNLLGERVYHNVAVLPYSSNDIDLTSSPQGIYILHVQIGTKMYTRKLIVQ